MYIAFWLRLAACGMHVDLCLFYHSFTSSFGKFQLFSGKLGFCADCFCSADRNFPSFTKDVLIRLPDGDSNDAEKVLLARNPFQVLQMEPQALDEKQAPGSQCPAETCVHTKSNDYVACAHGSQPSQVRTQYRKMALKVHPVPCWKELKSRAPFAPDLDLILGRGHSILTVLQYHKLTCSIP